MNFSQLINLSIILTLFGCKDAPLPKPSAYLRLEYPKAVYEHTDTPLPFSFDKNNAAQPLTNIKRFKNSNTTLGIDIRYPKLKGTIYLSYKTINNNNLDSLLKDAQNITQKHTLKADEIKPIEYINEASSIYGMVYDVGGNAASQSQFYVTDSINHFLSGALYFYARPNYDSIYPASQYLKKDITQLIESLRWKN